MSEPRSHGIGLNINDDNDDEMQDVRENSKQAGDAGDAADAADTGDIGEARDVGDIRDDENGESKKSRVRENKEQANHENKSKLSSKAKIIKTKKYEKYRYSNDDTSALDISEDDAEDDDSSSDDENDDYDAVLNPIKESKKEDKSDVETSQDAIEELIQDIDAMQVDIDASNQFHHIKSSDIENANIEELIDYFDEVNERWTGNHQLSDYALALHLFGFKAKDQYFSENEIEKAYAAHAAEITDLYLAFTRLRVMGAQHPIVQQKKSQFHMLLKMVYNAKHMLLFQARMQNVRSNKYANTSDEPIDLFSLHLKMLAK